jgi:hypothetical protein
MTRDMDLVRAILFKLEKEDYDGGQYHDLPEIEGFSDSQVIYHIKILKDAKLLEAENLFDGSPLIPTRLTWEGHEFLEAARDDTRWNKAKDIIQEKGGSLTFDVIKALLVQLARQVVGLP